MSFETRRLATVPAKFNADKVYIYFGPFGRRFAYQAPAGPLTHMIVDGVEGAGHQFNDSLVFSADGKRYAHRTGGRKADKRSERWYMMVDGKPQQEQSWISAPTFSQDGKKVGYWGATGVKIAPTKEYRGGKYQLLVNGKATGKSYGNGINPPTFSADGKHVGSLATRGNAWYVLVDKSSFGPYAMAGSPTFAAKGRNMAWAAVGNKGRAEIFLGKKKTVKGSYDALGLPRYSPNGKKLAYAAKQGDKVFMVVGKKKLGGDYTALGPVSFDAKGRRVAYAACFAGSGLMFGPIIMDCSVVEFAAAPPGGPGGGPALQLGKWSLVIDGKRQAGVYDKVVEPVFSPDGKTVAYRARAGKEWFVVVGKHKSKACQQLTSPVFSADGKQVAFGCRRGRELWWQVMEVK